MSSSRQIPINPNDVLFESFYKEVWRKLIPEGLTEAEVDFIEEIGKLELKSSVLDIMCGYGRHSIELAKRGYRVTAIDNLISYIEEINEIKTKQGLSIETIHGNVANTNFNCISDAVVCMGNCFSSFDLQTATLVLKNVYNSLQPNGIFIINSWMIGEIAIKHFQEKTWLYVDEFKYLLDNRYLLNPSRIETDHILINDQGEMQRLKGIDYIFSFAELEAMLNQAGFKMDEVYSTPRKRKYKFGDSRAYIVAIKQ